MINSTSFFFFSSYGQTARLRHENILRYWNDYALMDQNGNDVHDEDTVRMASSSDVESLRECIDQMIEDEQNYDTESVNDIQDDDGGDDDNKDDENVQNNGMTLEAPTTIAVSSESPTKRQAALKSRANETRSTSTSPSKLTNVVPPKNVTAADDDSHRYDQLSHWPMPDLTRNSRSRCKNPKCKKFSNWYCSKCNKHLCLKPNSNCFAEYHNK